MVDSNTDNDPVAFFKGLGKSSAKAANQKAVVQFCGDEDAKARLLWANITS